MQLGTRSLSFILIGFFALIASGVLVYLGGGNLATGWSNSAVQNWEQYGFLRLKGKLVINPGGYEALTRPEVYKGHRAASMYPVLLADRLFAWTGAGILAFHIALTLAVLISIWFLLGRSPLACVAGAAAILCPGLACYERVLCPVGTPLLMGLPFAAIALPLLVRPSLSPVALGVLFLTIAFYSSLNWATAFVHGMVLAYLLASQQISRRRVGLYLVLAGVSVILVGGVSVVDKSRMSENWRDFLGGYLWGSGGYGTYLTIDRAVVRLLFVGTVGLLPLLLVAGYVLSRRARRNPELPWRVFSPLGFAVIGVGTMRNYFGIQPWMAAPLFLVSLVLCLRLVLEGTEESSAGEETEVGGKILATSAFLMGCFVYGTMVTAMARLQQNPDFQSLLTLLRAHTARADTIVLVDTDPLLARIATSVAQCADRRVVVVHDLAVWDKIGGRVFLLSTSSAVALPLVEKTSRPALASCQFVQELLALYSTTVARRFPADRGFKPGTCYLYNLTIDKRDRTPSRLTGPI
jgi:hypothetical protein